MSIMREFLRRPRLTGAVAPSYPVDVIVSGLPWTVMPHERQRRILDAVTGVLRTGGRFSTFAYVHAAWTPPACRFAAEPAARFSSVERSPVVWPNLPRAYVHRAVAPVQRKLAEQAHGR